MKDFTEETLRMKHSDKLKFCPECKQEKPERTFFLNDVRYPTCKKCKIKLNRIREHNIHIYQYSK